MQIASNGQPPKRSFRSPAVMERKSFARNVVLSTCRKLGVVKGVGQAGL